MIIKILCRAALIMLVGLLTACQTSDSTMRDQGHNESYVMGFHDGRHSGMKEEGSVWEHYIKDHDKFARDNEYAAGWIAGEAEGKKLQLQAKAAGAAASGYQINREMDKNSPDSVIHDVMKGVDTTGMDALGK